MTAARRRLWVTVQVLFAALACGLALGLGWAGVALAVPLLLVWPGVWRRRRRAQAVASLLLPFYAGGLLMEVHAGVGMPMVGLATIAALAFCSIVLSARWPSETPPSPDPVRESATR